MFLRRLLPEKTHNISGFSPARRNNATQMQLDSCLCVCVSARARARDLCVCVCVLFNSLLLYYRLLRGAVIQF